ncbi:DUF6355 family natural product biosynthesis protein [Streptomyces sp. NPDC052496]|uniref:DUF6355 family natural product biosynthesis protein n=1 Tax=Streptomyces sp. NPDC052496 TaxID=3154951 RepID=UPI0034275D6D
MRGRRAWPRGEEGTFHEGQLSRQPSAPRPSPSACPSRPPAAATPCGFYETSRDAFHHHCTNDGTRVIIEVEVLGPNCKRCVGPGVTWLGPAGKTDGTRYAGRTC